jgi:hypothetical protein
MSYSSLWAIDKNFIGYEECVFKNSWLFSPISWDILLDKYLPIRRIRYGTKSNFISLSMFDNSINSDLNDCINNCNSMSDRIVWEITNQQIFFTKDKKTVADNIRHFLMENAMFNKNTENNTYPLQQSYIIERFNEIAAKIENLDENETPYFVLKNTSVDDTVENWFSSWDEETDEPIEVSLKDLKREVAEFVVIKDGKIESFILNTRFDYDSYNR